MDEKGEQLSLATLDGTNRTNPSNEIDSWADRGDVQDVRSRDQNRHMMKIKMAIQSSADSTMSHSSLASRINDTKAFDRLSQVELDSFLSKFLFDKCESFAEEILYTILIGRPLLLVYSVKNYVSVTRYAQALSMLVPGTNNVSVQLQRNYPLTVEELPDLKIVVISEGAFSSTSQIVRSWCSYFVHDQLEISAPAYKHKNRDQWLTKLLMNQSLRSPGQFRRYLQRNVARMQLRAYLYYWMFVIGVVKAPCDTSDSFKGPFLGMNAMSKREKVALGRREGVSDKRDFNILDYWSRIIQRQLNIASNTRISPRCFPPLMNEKPRKMCNVSLRDRLLRQHFDKPTALLVSCCIHRKWI
jgi:hypothetical protein